MAPSFGVRHGVSFEGPVPSGRPLRTLIQVLHLALCVIRIVETQALPQLNSAPRRVEAELSAPSFSA
jgi:hypothetical protein